MDEPGATLRGVTVGYGRQPVLRAVDLDLPAGQVTALVGPNGSGKTTLLRVLLGLLRPQAGRVERGAGAVGYVPQLDRSLGRLPVTAAQVVAMGVSPQRPPWARADAAERAAVAATLERQGVADLAARRFHDLSGGQRQRVLLARALVGAPSLLALDEPLRGLDLAAAARLVASLTRLAHEDGLAVVVATHSLDLVANHADHLALFQAGRVTSGPVADLFRPEILGSHLGATVEIGLVAGRRVVVPVEPAEPK